MAIDYATTRNYTYLLIPANNVKAIISMKLENISDAIKILYKCRFDSEVFGSTKLVITILNSLGVAYCANGDLKKAAIILRRQRKCFVNTALLKIVRRVLHL